MKRLATNIYNIILLSLITFTLPALSQESAILGSLEQALNDDSVGNIFGSLKIETLMRTSTYPLLKPRPLI